MQLNQLKPQPGSRHKRHIVGRGEGSGLGQTAGKGQKGQSSRTGETIMVGFEGGQTPLVRRIPKRGFNSIFKVHYFGVNLDVLDARFEKGAEVNGKTLAEKGIIRNENWPVKILSRGKLTKSLKVSVQKCSKSAEKALKDAGGSFTAVDA